MRNVIYTQTKCHDMSRRDHTGRRVEDPIGRRGVVALPSAVLAFSAIINNRIPIGDVREQNELPSFNVLGLQLLQRGGNSPLSNPFFAHWMHASTPWDLLAKTRFSIIRSIQSINSWSTVTPSLGLFCVIELYSIQSENINSRSILLHSVELNSTGVAKHDKINSISASYGRSDEDVLHHGTGRDGRNIREGLRGVLRHRGESRHNGAAGHPAGCGRAHRTAAPPTEAMI